MSNKNVTLAEKAAITLTAGVTGGIVSVLTVNTLLGAALIGLGFGILGAITIHLIGKARS